MLHTERRYDTGLDQGPCRDPWFTMEYTSLDNFLLDSLGIDHRLDLESMFGPSIDVDVNIFSDVPPHETEQNSDLHSKFMELCRANTMLNSNSVGSTSSNSSSNSNNSWNSSNSSTSSEYFDPNIDDELSLTVVNPSLMMGVILENNQQNLALCGLENMEMEQSQESMEIKIEPENDIENGMENGLQNMNQDENEIENESGNDNGNVTEHNNENSSDNNIEIQVFENENVVLAEQSEEEQILQPALELQVPILDTQAGSSHVQVVQTQTIPNVSTISNIHNVNLLANFGEALQADNQAYDNDVSPNNTLELAMLAMEVEPPQPELQEVQQMEQIQKVYEIQKKKYVKPPYSYSSLIAMALKNSKTGALPVAEIYQFMCFHFPFFRTATAGWKNSVRHNLSLNKTFEKIEKPDSQQRKGCLWTIRSQKMTKVNHELLKASRKNMQAIKNTMAYPHCLPALVRGNPKRLCNFSFVIEEKRSSGNARNVTRQQPVHNIIIRNPVAENVEASNSVQEHNVEPVAGPSGIRSTRPVQMRVKISKQGKVSTKKRKSSAGTNANVVYQTVAVSRRRTPVLVRSTTTPNTYIKIDSSSSSL